MPFIYNSFSSLDADVVATAKTIAFNAGVSLMFTADPREAVKVEMLSASTICYRIRSAEQKDTQ